MRRVESREAGFGGDMGEKYFLNHGLCNCNIILRIYVLWGQKLQESS